MSCRMHAGMARPKSVLYTECRTRGGACLQEERLELLGKLEQLPLKVRTEEQEALLQV